MRKLVPILVAGAMVFALAPAGAAADASDGTVQRALMESSIRAIVEGPSALRPQEAAAVLARKALGEEVAPEAVLEAAKALRDLQAAPEAEKLAFTDAFRLQVTGLKLALEARKIVADPRLVEEAISRGELSGTTPRPEVVERIGLSPPGLRSQADLLAAVGRISPAAVLRLADALPQPRAVWGQEIWDTYGTVLTAGWILLSQQAPQLAPWILPHNPRLAAFYLLFNVVGPVFEGDIFQGRVWMSIDLDDLLGLAFDLHGVTDTMTLQLPVSIYVALEWTLFPPSLRLIVDFPDRVIARDAQFVFAYPASSGAFPTRATAMDVLQSVYDRLGTLHNQAPPDPFISRPAGLDAPGLGDLSTQAPVVTYFGLQAEPEVGSRLGDAVRVRLRDPLAGSPLPLRMGLTAGYVATVKSLNLNILIVRWHNVGSGSIGLPVPSPQATIYYDVPEGNYVVPTRVDRYGPAVYFSDWPLTERLPLPSVP